jgi:NAD-specific glutamate dehydrogenase
MVSDVITVYCHAPFRVPNFLVGTTDWSSFVASKDQRRVGDMKQTIVDGILAANVKSKSLGKPSQTRKFLKKYVENVPVEDLQGRSEAVMARAAIDHLEFGAVRRPGQALLRIFNPTEKEHGYVSGYTFVEMVNDDMPFLVDSVSSAINRHKLSVHITVHPIIWVLRDAKGKLQSIASPTTKGAKRESYIRFAIERDTDPASLKLLAQEIKKVLRDVRLAVRDWTKMRERMRETSTLLENGPKGVDPLLRTESQGLLEWLADDHFTFLGYREYRLSRKGKRVFLNSVDGSGLGVLAGDDRGSRAVELTPEMRRVTRARDWLILTKANSRSTVHRSAFLDYVGIKIYDSKGNVVGERRFIGLLTSVAYNESPKYIPLLRHKIARVFERAHVDASGHRGKALAHIIETYPREELFQSSVQDLARTTLGILNLQDRRRVKFFLRRDTFRRFFSCLVYVPREKYTTAIRVRIEALLKDAFEGQSVDSAVQISDSALARVHIIVRTAEGSRPRISIHDIEAQIAALVVTRHPRPAPISSASTTCKRTTSIELSTFMCQKTLSRGICTSSSTASTRRYHFLMRFRSLKTWALVFFPSTRTKRCWTPVGRSGFRIFTSSMKAASTSTSKPSTVDLRNAFLLCHAAMPKTTALTDSFSAADSTGGKPPCCAVIPNTYCSSVCRSVSPTWKMFWLRTQSLCRSSYSSLSCSSIRLFPSRAALVN